MTEDLAARLEVLKRYHNVSIGTLNEMTIPKYAITPILKSLHNGYKKIIDSLVIPAISSFTPDQQIYRKMVNIPSNLQLVDPEFHIPAPIHLLISSGVFLLMCRTN